MVELSVDNKFNMEKEVFYFRNMTDCNIFLSVFKDHWCNVPFNEPKNIPDDTYIEEHKRQFMNKNPKERAKNNLNWGFNFVKFAGIGLTNQQIDFVNHLVGTLS